MSDWLSKGQRIKLHAKKEDESKMVAYVATTAWTESQDFDKYNVDSVYRPLSAADREVYNRVAEDLVWEIDRSVSICA